MKILSQAILGVCMIAACRGGSEPGTVSVPYVCGSASTGFDTVRYSPVDLGPRARGSIDYFRGSAERIVVRSAEEWERAWRRLADTSAVPAVNLRDSVLIAVASQEYATRPFRLEIEGVRRCRPSGEIVTLVRLHTQEAVQDMGDRSIRAILISRSALPTGDVRFVDLPTITR